MPGCSQNIRDSAKDFKTLRCAQDDNVFGVRRLLVTVDNAATVEIVRAELNRDAVAGEDADEVFAHTSRDVSESLMLVLQLNLEHRIRQCLNDDRHNLNCIFLRQTISFGSRGSSPEIPV